MEATISENLFVMELDQLHTNALKAYADLEQKAIQEQLDRLTRQASEIAKLIESYQQDLNSLKTEASVLLSVSGGRYKGAAGSFTQVLGGQTVSFDREKLTGLIAVLKMVGYDNMARLVEATQQVSYRAGQ